MMLPLVFLLLKSRAFGSALLQVLPCERGELEFRRFPDGETYVRFLTPVKGRDVVLVCLLDTPDDRVVPLYMAANVARELGAKSVGFVIPYLPYLRQDEESDKGNGAISRHFAGLLSQCCDWLVTVDPAIRHQGDLAHIYPVPTRVTHAASAIAEWITINVDRPILICSERQSADWVSEVAQLAKCRFHVLQSPGSAEFDAPLPLFDMSPQDELQPVVLEKKVSTGDTMIMAARILQQHEAKPPVCIAVHPLLVGDSYAAILSAGIDKLVSCNTIAHPTNRINVAAAVADDVLALLHAVNGGGIPQERECAQTS
ncbi:MAG TPA: ribose-phosphate diphosphokinase [Burkholderiaceae bacterium]